VIVPHQAIGLTTSTWARVRSAPRTSPHRVRLRIGEIGVHPSAVTSEDLSPQPISPSRRSFGAQISTPFRSSFEDPAIYAMTCSVEQKVMTTVNGSSSLTLRAYISYWPDLDLNRYTLICDGFI
jgi:hypothetical protein